MQTKSNFIVSQAGIMWAQSVTIVIGQPCIFPFHLAHTQLKRQSLFSMECSECPILPVGSVTCAVSLLKTFQSVKYRTFRACLFAALGLWGIVPGLHALILYGRAHQMRSAFALDICMGLVYLVRLPSSNLPCQAKIYGCTNRIVSRSGSS